MTQTGVSQAKQFSLAPRRARLQGKPPALPLNDLVIIAKVFAECVCCVSPRRGRDARTDETIATIDYRRSFRRWSGRQATDFSGAVGRMDPRTGQHPEHRGQTSALVVIRSIREQSVRRP